MKKVFWRSNLLLLCTFFMGCGVERRTSDLVNILDLFQILLSQSGWVKVLGCLVLVLFFYYVLKLLKEAVKITKKILLWLWRFFVVTPIKRKWTLAFFGFLLYLFWSPIHNWIEMLEQKLDPVYLDEFSGLTDQQLTKVFEESIKCDPISKDVVVTRTREIAAKLNCSPTAIYAVALNECGLNPFRIRDDGVAAGWIQFTRIGLSSLICRERTWTLEDVKQACKEKNASLIMDLTEVYLLKRFATFSKEKQVTALQVYLAVFKPSMLGKDTSKEPVLYEGYNNRSYYLNAGLDGWYLTDENEILHSRSHNDGIITVGELDLCMHAKVQRLVKRHINIY